MEIITKMTENEYPSDFFAFNKALNRFVGAWTPDKISSFPKKCLLYLWAGLIYIGAVSFLFLEFLILRDTLKDVNDFISQFGLLICHCFCIIKFGILVIQQKKLKELMEMLQDKRYQYVPSQGFYPCQRFSEAKKFSYRCSVFVTCLYSCAGLSAHISSETQINIDLKEGNLEGNKTCYDYVPYYFVIPFRIHTKAQCEYSFIFMHFCLNVFAWFAAGHDSLYAALLNCLTTQLDILCDALRTIRSRVLKRLQLPPDFQVFRDDDYPKLEEELNQELTHLTKHLMVLLRVADVLEKIFNLVTLAQTVTSLIVFTSCLFVTTGIPVTSPEFFAQMEYFTCMLTELTIFCWFGSATTRASEGITLAIYESDWYGASRRFKKSMILTMCRMQKPIYLTIGKFSPLRLNAIIMVFKCSFSYYTVFKRVDK